MRAITSTTNRSGSTRQIRLGAATAVAMLLAMTFIAPTEASAGGFMEFTKEHPLAEERADKAIVYVVRPTSVGAAVKSFFFVDDEVVGINRGSSYFFTYVDPGKHVFWSKAENVSALEMEVEAGKTYYLWQKARMGGMKARVKLTEATEAEGQAALKKAGKYTSLTAAGEARAQEVADEFLARAKEKAAKRAAEGEEADD